MKIILKIPASSANLGAGFDCLSLGLSIYNIYEFITHTKEMHFLYSLEQNNFRNNLVEYAYRENCKKLKKKMIPFHLKCQMNIPYSQGLGSSANAIVAGITLSRFVHGLSIDRSLILQEALELEAHPDNIAGCLYGGFNISLIENNLPINFHFPIRKKKLCCLLILFSRRTETALNRKKLPKKFPMDKIVHNLGRVAVLTAGFVSQNFPFLTYGVEDQLHHPFRLFPQLEIDELKGKLSLLDGYYGLALSGSGPSIILFCRSCTVDIKNQIREHFKNVSQEIKLKELKIDNRGMQVRHVG